MEVLTATIDIPVISSLYKLISDDDLSILDVVCLVAAIPVTLVYKAVTGSTPFPKGDAFTDGLLNASSFAEVQSQFYAPQTPRAAGPTAALQMSAATPPVLDDHKVKIFGLVAGISSLFGSIVLAYVSLVQKTLEVLGLESAYPKMLASLGATANVVYVSPNIPSLINAEAKTDPRYWYVQLNNALTGVSIAKGIVAIPLADSKGVPMWLFPGAETVLNIVWNVPVIMNIVDNKDEWDTTYKSLIPESIGNFAFNIGGMMELPIALVKDIKAKAIMVLAQDLLMVSYGGLMIVAGGIAYSD
jgi:hypothetical protein